MLNVSQIWLTVFPAKVVSLTKTELIEIVDRIYASWNQQVPQLKQKDIYEAWWRILEPFNSQDVHTTIDALVKQDGPMPRPGTVHKQTLRRITNWNPPTELQAWEQLRQAADNAYSGRYAENDMHPLVRQTIRKLGGTNTFRLHTNSDREQFTKTYQQIVRDAENALTIENEA